MLRAARVSGRAGRAETGYVGGAACTCFSTSSGSLGRGTRFSRVTHTSHSRVFRSWGREHTRWCVLFLQGREQTPQPSAHQDHEELVVPETKRKSFKHDQEEHGHQSSKRRIVDLLIEMVHPYRVTSLIRKRNSLGDRIRQ